jgi:hypothetical protein
MNPTSPKILATSKSYEIENNPKSLLQILTKQIHKVKCSKYMRKVKWGQEDSSNFFEVSKSQHSSLVLVGAPAQGYHSPLVLARTKYSLWDDHLPLRRSRSLTTAYNLQVGSPTNPLGWLLGVSLFAKCPLTALINLTDMLKDQIPKVERWNKGTTELRLNLIRKVLRASTNNTITTST